MKLSNILLTLVGTLVIGTSLYLSLYGGDDGASKVAVPPRTSSASLPSPKRSGCTVSPFGSTTESAGCESVPERAPDVTVSSLGQDEIQDVEQPLSSVVSAAISGDPTKLTSYVFQVVARCVQLASSGATESEPLCDPSQRRVYDQTVWAIAHSLASAGDPHGNLALGLWHLHLGDEKLSAEEQKEAEKITLAAPPSENSSTSTSDSKQPVRPSTADFKIAIEYFRRASAINEEAADFLRWTTVMRAAALGGTAGAEKQ